MRWLLKTKMGRACLAILLLGSLVACGDSRGGLSPADRDFVDRSPDEQVAINDGLRAELGNNQLGINRLLRLMRGETVQIGSGPNIAWWRCTPGYEVTVVFQFDLPSINVPNMSGARAFAADRNCKPRELTNGAWASILGIRGVANDFGRDLATSAVRGFGWGALAELVREPDTYTDQSVGNITNVGVQASSAAAAQSGGWYDD